ncbi:SHOCT domain-containing protein [Candidatus Woesearchaeota archaeon]|nr:SHOCT domain-containing protein [Candidatus Woesearchaeota archaeon]
MENDALNLEREIKFLNESLEAGIISEEEYEAKLQEIEERRSEMSEASEVPEQKPEDIAEVNGEEEVVEEIPEEKPEIDSVTITAAEDLPEEPEEHGVWKWVIIGALVILAIFFLFSYGKTQDGQPSNLPINDVEVLVVNDKNCSYCSTDRMKGVIVKLFPGAKFNEVDISSPEGISLSPSLKSLPAYIFDRNITKSANFGDFRRALDEQDDSFIMKSTATGSPYYFRRSETKNTLEVFVYPEDTSFGAVEKVINEVKKMFSGNLRINTIRAPPDSGIARELDITSSPAFVVNNRMKFSGLQTASAIRDKVCLLNECAA